MELKLWRHNMGITQEDLAEALDCQPSTISRIERGEITPSARLCGRIFRVTYGAVSAQDHQEAWEAAQKLRAARAGRRFTAICPANGVLPDAMPLRAAG